MLFPLLYSYRYTCGLTISKGTVLFRSDKSYYVVCTPWLCLSVIIDFINPGVPIIFDNFLIFRKSTDLVFFLQALRGSPCYFLCYIPKGIPATISKGTALFRSDKSYYVVCTPWLCLSVIIDFINPGVPIMFDNFLIFRKSTDLIFFLQALRGSPCYFLCYIPKGIPVA